jgi:O-antigen ligase
VTRTAPWLIGLGLFGYPIWASAAAIVAPSAGSLGGYAHRASVLVLALPFLVALVRGRLRLPRTDFWWILVAIWVGMLVRLIHEIAVGNAMPLDAAPSRVVMLFFGSMVLPALAMAAVSPDEDTGRKVLQATTWVVWAASVLAALASLAFARGYAAQVLGRASTDNINPIVIGHLGVSCAILSAFKFRDGISFTFVRLGFCCLGLALMAMSGSRGPLLVLVAVATLAAVRFLALRRAIWAPMWPALFTSVFTVPILLELPFLASTPVAQRLAMSSIINQRLTGRTTLIPEILEQFWANPVLGAGMSEPITRQHPHNLVLEAFFTMGILGGVLFCVMVLYTLWKAMPLILSDSTWCWAGFLYLQHLMFGLLSSSLYLLDQFWCLTAIVIAWSTTRPAPAKDS